MAVENPVEKKSFVLYADQIELWKNLPAEQAGKLIKHIFSYAVGEDADPPDKITELLFYQIKATLDRDQKKWEAVREARSASGKKGGRPKKAKKANGFKENQNEANKPVNVNVSAIVNDNETVDDKLCDIDELQKKYIANDQLIHAVKKRTGIKAKSILEERLLEFNSFLKAKDQYRKTWREYTSHFLNWHGKTKKLNKPGAPTFNSPVI